MPPKVWLITGCSSGIGLCLARTVLAAGDHVIATSRNPSSTPSIVQSFTAAGGSWVTLDVAANNEQLAAQVDFALQIYGHVDVLCNNAGYACGGLVEDTPMPLVRELFEINVFGMWRLVKLLLPQMRERAQGGTIINVSSLLGMTAFPGASAYAACKHAMTGFSEALAQEVAAFGIKVVLAEPGGVRTPLILKAARPPLSEAYQATPAAFILDSIIAAGGKEDGDPKEVAKKIVEVVNHTGVAGAVKNHDEMEGQMIRLLMGTDSATMMKAKAEKLMRLVRYSETVWKSTDLQDASASQYVR